MSETPTHLLGGLTVVSFESRMAKKMTKLLERQGAQALLAPSMQEVPLEDNDEVFRCYEAIQQGQIDALVLMTGIGTRTLVQTLSTRFPQDEVIATLNRIPIIVRGPKTAAACQSLKLTITGTAAEPNTWQELMVPLDELDLLHNKTIAVQEYGLPNTAFYEALEQRQSTVRRLPVYKWSLPDDTGPLQTAIDRIIQQEVDLALFTSAHQVVNLLQVAREHDKETALRRALARVGIVSIGPTTSERLREAQIFADLEASPNKMDDLVTLAANEGPAVAQHKQARAQQCWIYHTEAKAPDAKTLQASAFLRACRREPNEQVPLWLMRQAGRYMAEYQMVRQRLSFLDLCKNSDLAAEVTITALERLGVDAAIIFADILLPVEPMGVGLDFAKGAGPRILRPVRNEADIKKLQPVVPEESLAFVLQAIKNVRQHMASHIPLIGFCGAPFTMASYMIEGQGSRNYILTKTLMHSNPSAWHELMSKLTTVLSDFLKAQIEAGCQAVQVFDSWVGCLSPEDYRQHVMPYSQQLIASIPEGTPVIHFGTNTSTLLPDIKAAGGDVIGMDWRMDPASTWEQLGNVAVQGNLDPVILFSDLKVIRAAAKKILEAVGHKPGFIFNLGHGILPQTPVDHVMALVDYVHEWRAR